MKEKLIVTSAKKKSGMECLSALVKISEKYKNKKVPADLSVNDDYLYIALSKPDVRSLSFRPKRSVVEKSL